MDIRYGRQFPFGRPSIVGGGVSMIFEESSHAYIVENGGSIREVTIIRKTGEFYIAQLNGREGVKLRGSRLYASQEDAGKTLPKAAGKQKKTGYRSPYDYIH